MGKTRIVAVALTLLSWCAWFNRPSDPPVQVVPRVDLSRYAGTWILSRTPEMDGEVYDHILERLRDQHFDPSRLERTPQPGV